MNRFILFLRFYFNSKTVTFKSDVVLNPKQSKKLKAAEQQTALKEKQTTDRSSLKKKALEENDAEQEIYKREDIPRTKKLHKLELKKMFKKEKRTGKFNNYKILRFSLDISKPTIFFKFWSKYTYIMV